MIYRKNNYYEKLGKLTKTNFEIVSDFDRTITSSSSKTTWGIFSDKNILPKEYVFERNSLYNYYRPIELASEIDETVKLVAMEDWFSKHFELFRKYKLNKRQIADVFSDECIMILRKDFINFFNYLTENKIKLKILSAGIGDFVVEFLRKNNIDSSILDIRSNFFKFNKDEEVIGTVGPIINSYNKNKFAFEQSDNDYVILVGDQLSDIMMCRGYKRENIIAISFVTYDNNDELDSFKDLFDVVLTDEEGFGVILDDLKKVIG